MTEKQTTSIASNQTFNLILASFISLYFEMLVIRWLGSEVRLFSYFKNLIMLAAFLGLGVGFAFAKREKKYWEWFIPMLLLYVPLVILISTLGGGNVVIPGTSEYVWKAQLLPAWISTPLFILIILLFFSSTLGLFIPAGQLVGRYMQGLAPNKAYVINIIGSIIGIWAFALVSFLQLSPWIWFAIGMLGALWFLRSSKKQLVIGTAASSAIVLALFFTQGQTLWSPYYRVDYKPLSALGTAEYTPNNPEDAGYWLGANQLDHMTAVNLSEEYLEMNPDFAEYVQRFEKVYNFPYKLTDPDSLLVVGAGTGNDVAAGLRNGVQHIDAVEIDPLIYDIALNNHPEQPYKSEKVAIHIDDARAYFEKTDSRYDLIVFGFLDSQTLVSGMSGVRLDNYVYTVESIEAAGELLSEDGVIAVNFFAERWWIAQRIGSIIEEAFGKPPIRIGFGDTAWVMYLSDYNGSTEELMSICEQNDCSIEEPPEVGQIPLSTDDWPYLYNQARGIPISYWIVLLVVVGLAWFSMRKVYPDASSVNWHFFYLGGAFLLIEFKIITELALLFGSTWIVNAIAVTVVLIMVLIANLIVDRTRAIDLKWLYLLLVITLVISYVVPVERLLGLDLGLRVTATFLVMGSPLLFAAAIYAISIKDLSDVTEAFASNFFGSAVGGVLEYSAMATGIKSLYFFGTALYLGSWLTRPKK